MSSTSQLVLTGLITGTISVLTSIAIARFSFQFVKRPELQQTLSNALELERWRGESDRKAATREKVVKWAYPIIEACNDLSYRVANICEQGGYGPLSGDWETRRPRNWSATHSYFVDSTVYLFGRYFAYVELLRWNLGLDLYPQQTDKDAIFSRAQEVTSCLSIWPAPFTDACKGVDRQVFLLEQQALGQAFFDETKTRVITYAEFMERKGALDRYTSPIRDLLEDLSPEPAGDCRWSRVLSLRGPLAALQDECQRVVQSAL